LQTSFLKSLVDFTSFCAIFLKISSKI